MGVNRFWSNFETFALWVKNFYNSQVFPMIFPFSTEIPNIHLGTIHKWLTTLIALSSGDTRGQHDPTLCLWRPLDRTFNFLNAQQTFFDVSLIDVMVGGLERVLMTPALGWIGLEGNFRTRLPFDAEYNFLVFLMDELNSNFPEAFVLTTPEREFILDGVIPIELNPNHAYGPQNNPPPPPPSLN